MAARAGLGASLRGTRRDHRFASGDGSAAPPKRGLKAEYANSSARKGLLRYGILGMAMPDRADKKFYLETFGCQMNVHGSEKVIGTLISEGYRQVPTVEEADLVLYNPCSIRDKAEQ